MRTASFHCLLFAIHLILVDTKLAFPSAFVNIHGEGINSVCNIYRLLTHCADVDTRRNPLNSISIQFILNTLENVKYILLVKETHLKLINRCIDHFWLGMVSHSPVIPSTCEY